MILLLCLGLAVAGTVLLSWRKRHWKGGVRIAATVLVYYCAGAFAYVMERLLSAAEPKLIDIVYLQLADRALVVVVVLAAVQEISVDSIFNVFSGVKGEPKD